MRMGKCSVDKFIMDYLMTAGQSGFDLESTIDYFRQAIHPEFLKQIYRLPEMLTTMDNWVKYTQRFNNQWRELQSIKSSVPTTMPCRNNPFRYNSSNAPTSMNNSVVPMGIDAVCTPLTDDEQARLHAEGGCFYYQQKGHMANQCPAKILSRVYERGIGHVQPSDGKVGYHPAQASGALAGQGGGYGRALPARAQISGETTTSGKSRSVAMTNPFWARLAARQAYASRENASVRQKESEISREEVQRLIGKMRWDEQEVLFQELSEGSKQKELDMDF
ncbi:hypothetical protein HETIRDRAFT_424594 [Heterobasidion irregulare TC 32-1]|uniref:Uncharacterized protein n=1 Tax=Heterobasidion irregulare (strain TC 32-1) TaxID=747525 RepID=W4KJE5_HETIT|nr:uncharacterized protein HETIRDRAFT_424594 [Heterobasidion irregulare TC 32-1]ETW85191.1 hypothetical protein HETIRDRAFT_424594 [Heterobasidion irregulare TC 32-1]